MSLPMKIRSLLTPFRLDAIGMGVFFFVFLTGFQWLEDGVPPTIRQLVIAAIVSVGFGLWMGWCFKKMRERWAARNKA